MEEDEAHKNYELLKKNLAEYKSVAVAFSGGVDSTFLLKTAHDVLGENAVAVTVCSQFVPGREVSEAQAFCQKEGITHITLTMDQLSVPEVRGNPKNRCYYCKKSIFTEILSLTEKRGINVVCEGSNLDDTGDWRPGMKATQELGIKSPLKDCSLTKSQIREISKELSLPTWNKPSAACLASRMAYGEEITEKKLRMVEEAENFLHDSGFIQCRVRNHGNIARIEIPESGFEFLIEKHSLVKEKLLSLGFTYVTMDLGGFQSGSMNKEIDLFGNLVSAQVVEFKTAKISRF